MSTLTTPTSEPSSRQRGASECKPLLDAATKDLFRKNAFRITGLPVDATTREVARHADKLKMLAELGQGAQMQEAAFQMKPPPGLDQIREAIQSLKDPEKRLIDEFFWFWPEEFGQSQFDSAIQALAKGDSKTAIKIWSAKEESSKDEVVACHNLALVYQINALDWENHSVKNEVSPEQQQEIADYWTKATDRWQSLATNDSFWEKVAARIRQLNEPNLTTGFAWQMRLTMSNAIGKINAELALAFAESERFELARPHICFLRKIVQDPSAAEKVAELVLTPAIDRFKDQIKRAQESTKDAPQDGANTAKELFQRAQRFAFLLDLFFGEESDIRNELLDEAVAECNRIQVAYHNSQHDDETCLEILNLVLPLATSAELQDQIRKNIATLNGFLAGKVLKSIQETKDEPSARLARFKRDATLAIAKATGFSGIPSSCDYLSTSSAEFSELFDNAALVLRGISLDAWNNHQDRPTAVAANELAIRHAKSPELKRRLTEDKAVLLNLREPPAARSHQYIRTGIGLALLAVFIVLGIINSRINNSLSGVSYTQPAPGATKYAPTAQSASPSTASPSDATPAIVVSGLKSRLDKKKAEIETDRAQLQALDAQVKQLRMEIDNDRLTLDTTSQSDVDAFNAKVDRYNALVQEDKDATAAFNENVDYYNAALQQYRQ